MKIMLLALLFPVFCFAQSEKAANSNTVFQDSIAKTSFYLKDSRIVYQKVFKSDLKQKALADQVYLLLKNKKDFKFDLDGVMDVDFNGRLCLHQLDTERYNITLFSAPVALHLPMDAMIVIQVKDHKYRVTISEVVFKYGETAEMRLDNELTKENRSKLNLTKSNLKLAGYLDKDFDDFFKLNDAISSDF